MTDFAQLDNPVFSSLTTGHSALALRHGQAVRYPREVSSLVALAAMAPEAFDDLRTLVRDGETVGLVSGEEPAIPAGWEVRRSRTIDQMVCESLLLETDMPLEELGESDVAEMLALAKATEPGPFVERTHTMGRFRGIRDGEGRLMAMAGERMRLQGLVEISAVCTWPEYRGRGLAKALVVAGARRIMDEGNVPFLHVKGENAAKLLYERIGFRTRRPIHYTVMTALTA